MDSFPAMASHAADAFGANRGATAKGIDPHGLDLMLTTPPG